MKFKTIIAIFICKALCMFLRLLRRGGTALPGKIAVGICPNLLQHLAKDVSCIAITGTNGKTTSARMLEQFYIDRGVGYIANKSGSNLMRGIVVDFALNATATGKPKKKYAVIECDEAASKAVFKYIDPDIVLVTNVFSDQLDRFADVGATVECIKNGIINAPHATVCLNADDPLTSSLADDIPNKVVFFGVNTETYDKYADEFSDVRFCARCNAEYEYDYRTYGHLGGFRCPGCGHARRSPDIAVAELSASDEDSQTVRLQAHGEVFETKINIPGAYNIYNAAGVVAAAFEAGFSSKEARIALESFERGFGRMEKFTANGVAVRIILVKNAVGCNQALNYLLSLSGDALLAICLNDNIADGTDISWIENVNFNKLLDMGERLRGAFISGTRAAEMTARVRKAGVPDALIKQLGSPDEMLDAALAGEAPVYILPTYTALLEIRASLRKKYGIKGSF
ncbi:MAG: MurT ligase domain-containing protein [Oscillospiraceae bacterium]|nr:MurT ligase domain-containing protein [Oscillospiraceae bacterium]